VDLYIHFPILERKVFENRVLRRISEQKKDEMTE
jgi:hypothetical protein